MKVPMATKTPATKTAPKKNPGASTAVSTKPNTNMVSIQEALRAQAAGMAERTAPASGNSIRVTQDKKFLLPDGSKSSGPLDLVVVDFVATHNFYAGAYDKDNIQPPACFAIGTNPRDMTPSKNSPQPQAKSCQDCPMNQFGSDGTGKACKNGRALAVLPPDADADTELWKLSVSPTALKGFDGYVGTVARTFGMPPVGVVTTVEFDDSVTYAKLAFSNPVPNECVAVGFARQAEAREMLMAEPDVSGFVAPSRTPAKKSAGRR